MLAHIILATALCLVRCETAGIPRQPTPAPPQAQPEVYFFILQDNWYGGGYYAIGYAWEYESEHDEEWRPEQGGPFTVVRKIAMSELMDRAREEAKNPPRKHLEQAPCFPGEYPGDKAQQGGE